MATFTSKMLLTYLGVLVSVKEEGKKREVFESQFCFLTTKLVTNREMLNDFNEETMFLKVFVFPEFVSLGR